MINRTSVYHNTDCVINLQNGFLLQSFEEFYQRLLVAPAKVVHVDKGTQHSFLLLVKNVAQRTVVTAHELSVQPVVVDIDEREKIIVLIA
jgi:hypothetical protein